MNRKLKQGTDIFGNVAIGFDHEGHFISNPFVSPGHGGLVNSVEAYGLSREDADELLKLNDALKFAVHSAVNDATRNLLILLPGITRAPAAELFFSDEDKVRPIAEAIAAYLLHEVELNQLA